MSDDICPVCERASEFIYRLDETEEKINKSKKNFDKKLNKLEGETNTEFKEVYKRINTVDGRINALILACTLLLASVVLSKVL